MNTDSIHDGAELPFQDRGAPWLIVRSRCWPPPSGGGPAMPMQPFDELDAAALACTEAGGPGHRNAYECLTATVAEATPARGA